MMKIGEKHPSTIFIDFGETKTSFIIYSGGSIRFTSSIPVSSQQLTQAIAEKLGLFFEKAEELKVNYGLTLPTEEQYDIRQIMEPVLDELVLQVKRYISFYQGHAGRDYSTTEGASIEKIILCGGGANLKGLPEFLFAGLQIRVEVGDPLINLLVSKNVNWRLLPQKKVLSFATAIGLGIRAADYKNSEDGRIL
jgi:type IV pilus assembly protein PilM